MAAAEIGGGYVSVLVRALLGAPLRTPTRGLTVGLFRSRLVHDSSAIIGRLAALLAEWQEGRYRRGDPGEVGELLAELRRIFEANAATAAGSVRSIWVFLGLIHSFGRLCDGMRRIRRQESLGPRDLSALAVRLESLRLAVEAFAEAVCRRQATRLAEIVCSAAADVRRQTGSGLLAGSISIVVEGADAARAVWVPVADAVRWHDLFKNLIGNAARATTDALKTASEATASSEAGEAAVPPVVVRLTSLRGQSGVLVEIEDQGVGMNGEDADRIWTSGVSRHGPGHGYGLTEAKREFLLSRARLELQSIPGFGTRFRIELDARDIPLSVAPQWNQPPLVGAAALVAGTAGFLLLWSPAADTVGVSPPNRLQGFGASGKLLWTRELQGTIAENLPASDLTGKPTDWRRFAPAFTTGDGGKVDVIAISVVPSEGSGWVELRDGRGRLRRSHPLGWTWPGDRYAENLSAVWIAAIPWANDTALMLQVRNGRETASSTQFFTPGGDSLGAYYHWGHLGYRSTSDLDRDGRTEIMLYGVNNAAANDRTIFPEDPGCLYVPCLVLLEIPEVSGQSYPYSAWPGMPRATEKAYVLIPPLQRGQQPILHEIVIGDHRSLRAAVVEVVLRDGRRYFFSGTLVPDSCLAGDYTDAWGLAGAGAIEPAGPVVHLARGVRTDHTVPVRRKGGPLSQAGATAIPSTPPRPRNAAWRSFLTAKLRRRLRRSHSLSATERQTHDGCPAASTHPDHR